MNRVMVFHRIFKPTKGDAKLNYLAIRESTKFSHSLQTINDIFWILCNNNNKKHCNVESTNDLSQERLAIENWLIKKLTSFVVIASEGLVSALSD
eukprot:Pgem_evm1s10211